ncbi:MAG: hypothetical protein FJ253_10580 [Phycisphaerae bacterium]|nr:hypothetical protein [Phycisphaerae bacterium]
MIRRAGSVLVAGPLPGAAASHRIRSIGGRPRRTAGVMRIAAWIGSFAVHGAIAAAAFLVTWTVVARVSGRDAPLVTLMDFRAPSFDPVVLPPIDDSGDGAGAPVDAAPPMPEASLRGMDRPAEIAPGDPMAKPLAPIAVTAPERPASFAGLVSSNAGRVAYVVDASGSLVGTFPAIQRELESSLARLDRRQSFSIVFFQKGEAVTVPPGRMMPAEPANVSRAVEWMRSNVFPAGRSNPVPAMKAALAMRPDLVFLLSSGITGAGEFELSQEEMLSALDRLNPRVSRTGRRRSRIQCVQFLERDPGGTLERIAEAHGGPGAFRYLSRDELGLAPGAPVTGAPIE